MLTFAPGTRAQYAALLTDRAESRRMVPMSHRDRAAAAAELLALDESGAVDVKGTPALSHFVATELRRFDAVVHKPRHWDGRPPRMFDDLAFDPEPRHLHTARLDIGYDVAGNVVWQSTPLPTRRFYPDLPVRLGPAFYPEAW